MVLLLVKFGNGLAEEKSIKNNDLAALTIGYYKITISVKGIFTYAHVDKK